MVRARRNRGSATHSSAHVAISLSAIGPLYERQARSIDRYRVDASRAGIAAGQRHERLALDLETSCEKSIILGVDFWIERAHDATHKVENVGTRRRRR
jgi:hypothetical protein